MTLHIDTQQTKKGWMWQISDGDDVLALSPKQYETEREACTALMRVYFDPYDLSFVEHHDTWQLQIDPEGHANRMQARQNVELSDTQHIPGYDGSLHPHKVT